MSKLVLTLYDDNHNIIKTEYFMKLTEISNKYSIPYASLFAIDIQPIAILHKRTTLKDKHGKVFLAKIIDDFFLFLS